MCKPDPALTELQRPPSAAAEDRNPVHPADGPGCHEGSGRRPRRPRIATLSTSSDMASGLAAAAVRGGRGSQREHLRTTTGPRSQRPPSAAAEDRNDGGTAGAVWDGTQRPPSAAAEDRNHTGPPAGNQEEQAAAAVRGGRGSQRGLLRRRVGVPPPAAAAVRGGRGSQHEGRRRRRRDHGSGRRPRRPRIATQPEHRPSEGLTGSGRRPRRPRIATPRHLR